MKLKELAAATLVLALAFGSQPAYAQQTAAVVDRAAVEQALGEKVQSDEERPRLHPHPPGPG